MDLPWPRKRMLGLVVLLLGLVAATARILSLSPHPLHRTTTTAPETLVEPANATLGFGALLAVSHAASPRRAGLVAAAHLARIEVTIPEQPAWTEGDVERFRVKGEGQGGSRVSRGSALAWLGHLNVLRWFLSTELETALILEDDVDFSLHLRSTQTPLAAAAIRTLLSPNPHPHPHPSPATTADQNPHYWGPPSAWELLYLGHCADLIPPSLLPATPHLAYHDPSAPPPAHLTPQTHALLSALRAPPATRLLHRSHWPLCTFAYAVTRASAARILSTFGTEDAGDGTGCVAFDVRLLEACRDRGWACYTVAPELFHHVAARSEIDVANSRPEDGGRGDAREGADGETAGWTRTPNIACGARQAGFAGGGSGNGSLEEWLSGVVGTGGCLEDWGEEDGGILS